MWKAKKYPDVWQGWHQALEVQQALIIRIGTIRRISVPGTFLFPGFFSFLIFYMCVRLPMLRRERSDIHNNSPTADVLITKND